MSNESEYFAKMLAGVGNEKKQSDGMIKQFRDIALFLMINDYAERQYDEPSLFKEKLVEVWEDIMVKKFDKEIKEYKEMSDSTAGALFGSMIGESSDLEERFVKNLKETKRIIRESLEIDVK